MNDHHRLNEHGLDLLTTFEKGDPSVPLSPGGAALAPYVCPGGELTIGYGCTKWFGGRDVLPTDRLRDEAHARELLAEQVIEYEDAVRRLVTVPLNSNQFSALVCFAFNCGIKGLAGSTILKRTNESRFDDAAEAFGMWIFATSGQHKRALRGLLRRRYAEALLSMSYQFDEACDDDFIRLKVKRPPNNIGTDRVEFKTPFSEVLVIAQRFPLPPLDEPTELILTTPAPSPPQADEAAQRQDSPAKSPAAGAAPVIEKLPETMSGPAAVQTGGAGVSRPLPSPTPAPATIPAPQRAPEAGGLVKPAPVVLPSQVPKPPMPPVPLPPSVQVNSQPDMGPTTRTMWVSKRFWGGVLIIGGRLIIAADVTGSFSPAVKAFIGDGILMDWGTGVIVTVLGEIIFNRGEKKAEGPMDTPKRIALMTPSP